MIRSFYLGLAASLAVVHIAVVPAATQNIPSAQSGTRYLSGGSDGDYLMQPSWSPVRNQIAVSGPEYRGISILDLDSSLRLQLSDEPAAGFGLLWASDGETIVLRPARFESGRRLNAVKEIDISTGESIVLVDFTPERLAVPSSYESVDALNQNQKAVRVTVESGKPVLNLTYSPDKSKVAFEEMGGNLFVMDVGGSNRIDLGEGNRPTWSPDGEWIAFQRTEDDGHQFTASDLFAVSTESGTVVRLTDTPDALEMNPTWSPDASQIAFDDRGAIYVLPIGWRAR